ncbi:MAG: adenylate/guanylate cyclase domain-containing protein [Actinomycetota bacterium]|nr:adenylate/guanylate cyclase domain-containing protein [Actinomycetota bacterium]
MDVAGPNPSSIALGRVSDDEPARNIDRSRIDQDDTKIGTVLQVAGALEPVLPETVAKNPSRIARLGFSTAHLLAGIAVEDEGSNERLAELARGSTVGIVFVDIAGFMSFTARRGDEVAAELLRQYNDMIVRAIIPSKGECVKSLGDGFLLAFPSASQGVRGAVALRTAIERFNDGRPEPVLVRIAVHAGEPLIEGDDLLGHDVNLTARLLDHCRPGDIIVSEAAGDLASKRLRKISSTKPKRIKIKGLTSRVTVMSVDPR